MLDTGNLIRLLEQQLSAKQAPGSAKLQQAVNELHDSFSKQRFFYLFALCPRWFDKQVNVVATEQQHEWDQVDIYGVLRSWQYPQLARLLLLINVARIVARERYVECINELYKTADVNELILLGQSLMFLPDADLFIERARECARSNIAPVFSAIAHRSAYAWRFFDKIAWNQLILKAAFLAQPIWSIAGLKQRNNLELVKMLRHYVDERQAAQRSVPWDLWCCIGWLASSDKELEYLQQQSLSASVKTQAAIALALSENPAQAARDISKQMISGLPDQGNDAFNWPQLAAWPD